MWLERQFAKFFGVTFSEAGSQSALKDREMLFRQARESIKIVSVTLPEKDPLIEAAERGVSVEVITTQGQNWLDIIRLTRKGVSVFELKHKPPMEFDVVDGKHLGAEEPYTPGLPSRLRYIVRNTHHVPEYLQRFASLKQKATPYS